jgi:hypothetical protein
MKTQSSTHGQRVRLTNNELMRAGRLQRQQQVDALTARRARILELLHKGFRQCDVAETTGPA